MRRVRDPSGAACAHPRKGETRGTPDTLHTRRGRGGQTIYRRAAEETRPKSGDESGENTLRERAGGHRSGTAEQSDAQPPEC